MDTNKKLEAAAAAGSLSSIYNEIHHNPATFNKQQQQERSILEYQPKK